MNTVPRVVVVWVINGLFLIVGTTITGVVNDALVAREPNDVRLAEVVTNEGSPVEVPRPVRAVRVVSPEFFVDVAEATVDVVVPVLSVGKALLRISSAVTEASINMMMVAKRRGYYKKDVIETVAIPQNDYRSFICVLLTNV